MNNEERDCANEILVLGPRTLEYTLPRARKLGLDIAGLMKEHERLAAASYSLDLAVDLCTFRAEDPNLVEKLEGSGLPKKAVNGGGCRMGLSVPWRSYNLEPVILPDRTLSLAEVMALGIIAIEQIFQNNRKDYPTNRFPGGTRDWQIGRFDWDEHSGSFFLGCSWNPSVKAVAPAKLHPNHSIDLRRKPPAKKRLISARAFPELSHVTLSVSRQPNGELLVNDLYVLAEACPPPQKAQRSDLPDRVVVTYPGEYDRQLKWSGFYPPPIPAGLFVQGQILIESARPRDWLGPYQKEVLLLDSETKVTFSDLRASIESGVTGPAPLPKGANWPKCPCCGLDAEFVRSLDVRDIGFADLLPGTSLVVFFCTDCYNEGEWLNCSTVVWLGRNDEIVLLDRGNPSPVVQIPQWYGADAADDTDLPDAMWIELEALEESSGNPNAHLRPSPGPKVGGSPYFLGEPETFFDRNGVVMEYIAQIDGSEAAGGYGYVYHSTTTGETYIEFQDT